MAQPGFPFLGTSEPITAFLRDLEAVAGSDTTVLLQGGTGAGKSAGARLLHGLGARREGPLVAVHLAALSPTLIESALFGHERGAFTDAHRSRQGLFARASGGTIVLDDVDLLAPEVQVKLLRVLQERRIEPLGSERSLAVDLRVVSTTNKDLRAEVEGGAFREDLYYRLAVVVLDVPNLRARVADIGELAEALIGRVAARAGVAKRALSRDALARLAQYSWPGNIRELENAIERVLVLGAVASTAAARGADSAESNMALEPMEPAQFDFLWENRAGAAEEVAAAALAHGLGVDDLIQAVLRAALAEHRGNVSAAARAVGLTRRAFEYRLDRDAGEEGA